jgi:nicotinate-nucleotide adenylyltransferase
MAPPRLTGLFGGAFDPPHNGHLALADEAMRHFRLGRLVVVVTGQPPHKAVQSDAETRFRLAEAAFGGRPGVELSRHELDRAAPSYTVETARWAAQTYRDAIFLIGADEFADFLAWKDPNGILEHVRLGVATRPGYPEGRLAQVLSELERPDRVEPFTIPEHPVSSRELRARIARGESVHGLVPGEVARLMVELGLYR